MAAVDDHVQLNQVEHQLVLDVLENQMLDPSTGEITHVTIENLDGESQIIEILNPPLNPAKDFVGNAGEQPVHVQDEPYATENIAPVQQVQTLSARPAEVLPAKRRRKSKIRIMPDGNIVSVEDYEHEQLEESKSQDSMQDLEDVKQIVKDVLRNEQSLLEKNPGLTSEDYEEIELEMIEKSNANVCKHCGKKYLKLKDLTTHVRGCTSQMLPFKCNKCPRSFPRKSQLLSHLRTHSGVKPHLCGCCPAAFTWSGQLAIHAASKHPNEKAFKCPVCSECFLKATQLTVHAKVHPKASKHACLTCGELYTYQRDLRRHQMTHSAENEPGSEAGKPATEAAATTDLLSQTLVESGLKPFGCPICGKCFNRRDHLMGHLRKHTGEKPHQCGVCGDKFTWHNQLSIHAKKHPEGSLVYKCMICEESFSEAATLAKHSRTHPRSKKDQDKDELEELEAMSDESPAQESRFSANRIVKSMAIYTTEGTVDDYVSEPLKAYRCNMCAKVFQRKLQLQSHLRTHTGEKPHQCGVCDQSFSWSNQLALHVKKNHPGESAFKCRYCGVTFVEARELVLHTRQHRHQHECQPCRMVFPNLRDFVKHTREHDLAPGETLKRGRKKQPIPEPKELMCHICAARFSRKDNLKEHLRIHTGERPFICDTCGKLFRLKGHLVKHQRIHTGEKPYQCETCFKSFSDSSKLARHVQMHTGSRPFICRVCGKYFTRKESCIEHAKTHVGEKRARKPKMDMNCQVCARHYIGNGENTKCRACRQITYECGICGDQFLESQHLLEHTKTHTGDWQYQYITADQDLAGQIIQNSDGTYQFATTGADGGNLVIDVPVGATQEVIECILASSDIVMNDSGVLVQQQLQNPDLLLQGDNLALLTSGIDAEQNVVQPSEMVNQIEPSNQLTQPCDRITMDDLKQAEQVGQSHHNKDSTKQIEQLNKMDQIDENSQEMKPSVDTKVDSNTENVNQPIENLPSQDNLRSAPGGKAVHASQDSDTEHDPFDSQDTYEETSQSFIGDGTPEKLSTAPDSIDIGAMEIDTDDFLEHSRQAESFSQIKDDVSTKVTKPRPRGDVPFKDDPVGDPDFDPVSEFSDSRAKPYECSTCGKKFHRPRWLIRHKRNVHDEEASDDVLAMVDVFAEAEKIDDDDNVDAHNKDWHDKKVKSALDNQTDGDITDDFKLSHKGRGRPKGSKNKHKNPKREADYKCTTCSKTFTTLKWLLKHNETPHDCTHCGKTFLRIKSLREHMKTHQRQNRHQCPLCEKGFYKFVELINHASTHEPGVFKCGTCEKTYAKLEMLIKHTRYHTDQEWPCRQCGKTFPHKWALNAHTRRHLGEMPYQCHICGKTFSNMGNHKSHVRIHTGERPFICETCGKCFTEKGHLVKHVRTHTGEKPYVCKVCNVGFTDSSKLNRHFATQHSGMGKTYRCQTCNKSFSRIDNLHSHEKTHTSEKGTRHAGHAVLNPGYFQPRFKFEIPQSETEIIETHLEEVDNIEVQDPDGSLKTIGILSAPHELQTADIKTGNHDEQEHSIAIQTDDGRMITDSRYLTLLVQRLNEQGQTEVESVNYNTSNIDNLTQLQPVQQSVEIQMDSRPDVLNQFANVIDEYSMHYQNQYQNYPRK